jgi:hypothetical protein
VTVPSKDESLTGQAAIDFFEELERRDQEKRADNLARAKAEAARRGKEPFDLEKLETMCSTRTSEGNQMTVERRRTSFEYEYYVSQSKLMTLAEFAEYINRVNLG